MAVQIERHGRKRRPGAGSESAMQTCTKCALIAPMMRGMAASGFVCASFA